MRRWHNTRRTFFLSSQQHLKICYTRKKTWTVNYLNFAMLCGFNVQWYYVSDIVKVDEARKQLAFHTKSRSLENLPPTSAAPEQHIKRVHVLPVKLLESSFPTSSSPKNLASVGLIAKAGPLVTSHLFPVWWEARRFLAVCEILGDGLIK